VAPPDVRLMPLAWSTSAWERASTFDTADIYSEGASEETLGAALKGRRDRPLIATTATFRGGGGANDVSSSRCHLIRACEASLKRLGTDRIDLYFMHGFHAITPVDETPRALSDLIGWQDRLLTCSRQPPARPRWSDSKPRPESFDSSLCLPLRIIEIFHLQEAA
jgi:hypothetical protein